MNGSGSGLQFNTDGTMNVSSAGNTHPQKVHSRKLTWTLFSSDIIIFEGLFILDV